MTAHILVVEDEAKLARLIELDSSGDTTPALRMMGLQVLQQRGSLAGSNDSGLVTPWFVGPGIRRLRSTGNKVPIIILSAKHEVSACVAGFGWEPTTMSLNL